MKIAILIIALLVISTSAMPALDVQGGANFKEVTSDDIATDDRSVAIDEKSELCIKSLLKFLRDPLKSLLPESQKKKKVKTSQKKTREPLFPKSNKDFIV